MAAECNNITRQNRVWSYLQESKLPLVKQNEKYEVREDLKHIRNLVGSFALQGSMSYRSEDARVKYLYNSVLSLEWAKTALTQCYENCHPCLCTHVVSFQGKILFCAEWKKLFSAKVWKIEHWELEIEHRMSKFRIETDVNIVVLKADHDDKKIFN